MGLPLDSTTAEKLKTCCALAPFGKGAHTVVDRTVRETWEVDQCPSREHNKDDRVATEKPHVNPRGNVISLDREI